MAAEKYRPSLWTISLMASTGRRGGIEVETKLALTAAWLALFARVSARGEAGRRGQQPRERAT